MTRPTVGRPPRFTDDQAVHAAYRAGLAGFSVKTVARELDISPAAVYRRFGTRQGLLNACMATAFDGVLPLTGTPDRRETLLRFADQWWALCLRCPDIEIVVRDYPDTELRLMARGLRTYRDRLTDLGLTTEQATFAGSMIAVNLLQLRHRLPATTVLPTDVPDEVDAQRATNLGFILDALATDWPGWQVRTPAGPVGTTGPDAPDRYRGGRPVTDAPAPPRRPGRTPPVTGEDIVRTALGLGIDRFTLSDVARTLGITVQSVYRRFPARRDLLEHCIDTVLAGVPDRAALDPVPETWQDLTHACADQWWALCLRHPGFSTVVTRYDGPLERFLDVAFASYLEHFLVLGWTKPQALFSASQVVSAAARVDHFLSQDESRSPAAVAAATRHVRDATGFIVTGLGNHRPDRAL